MNPPSGEAAGSPLTALYGVFGHPVSHSLSPALFRAAFAARGMDAVYLAFDVPPERLPAALEAVRALGMGGVNLTIPHKRAAVALLDVKEGDAGATGSVNTVAVRHGKLTGHSTDGEGFLRALGEETGFDPRGGRVCLLGTGGAALAVAAALLRAGAAEILAVTRRHASRGSGWPQGIAGRVRFLTYEELGDEPELDRLGLLVNATPLGMAPREGDMPPVPARILRPGLTVYDLVYRPARTRLMSAAGKGGAFAVNGLGMLIHQAALAFTIWTSLPAPIEEMRSAATKST